MTSSRISRRLNVVGFLRKIYDYLLAPFRYVKNNPVYSSAILGAVGMLGLYLCGLVLAPGLFFPVVAAGGFIINLASAITCAYYGAKWARQNPVSMILGGFVGFVLGALISTFILKIIPVVITYAVCITVIGAIGSGLASLFSAMAANSIVNSVKAHAREQQRQRNWREREDLLNADHTSSNRLIYRRVNSSTARVITQTTQAVLIDESLVLQTSGSPVSVTSSISSSPSTTPSSIGTPEPRSRSLSTDEGKATADTVVKSSIHFRYKSR